MDPKDISRPDGWLADKAVRELQDLYTYFVQGAEAHRRNAEQCSAIKSPVDRGRTKMLAWAEAYEWNAATVEKSLEKLGCAIPEVTLPASPSHS